MKLKTNEQSLPTEEADKGGKVENRAFNPIMVTCNQKKCTVGRSTLDEDFSFYIE